MRTVAIGRFPRAALAEVVGWLSPPAGTKDASRRAAVLEARRVCTELRALLAEECVGGAGWLDTRSGAAQLGAAETAGLGRALVVRVSMELARGGREAALEEALETLALAVRRGHMIWFVGLRDRRCPQEVARAAEALLVEASDNNQLLHANLDQGTERGWSVDAMAQLRVVALNDPEHEAVATIAGGGALDRLVVWHAAWTQVSMLKGLHEVRLAYCAVDDLSPLADVPKVVVRGCRALRALPAMRNAWLEVFECHSLQDVAGLAGGRVRRLRLWNLPLKDASGIGAMEVPPHTVVLKFLHQLKDLSMLAGVGRLEVVKCNGLDFRQTAAALGSTVATIVWDGRVVRRRGGY